MSEENTAQLNYSADEINNILNNVDDLSFDKNTGQFYLNIDNTNKIELGKIHGEGHTISLPYTDIGFISGKNHNIIAGSNIHVEGEENIVAGESCHVEGRKTEIRDMTGELILNKYTVVRDEYNKWHNGRGAHTEGQNTIASSNSAHAEGYETYAIGSTSHTEGHRTLATNTQTHAEGYNTWAHGPASHAEGAGTEASGVQSHAQNNNTLASGWASSAAGSYTKATNEAQFVIGIFNHNKPNNLFEIGNGNSESNRKNAFEVDKDGKAFVSGKEIATKENIETEVNDYLKSPEVQQSIQDTAKDVSITQEKLDTTLNSLTTEIQTTISQAIKQAKIEFLDTAYPIDSIYMSMSDTSPETLFGGKWERIEGRFLLGAGQLDETHNYTVGDISGKPEVQLTVETMPEHNHKGIYFWEGAHQLTYANSAHPGDGQAAAINIDGVTSFETAWIGGNQPHNNMPPYLAVYMWKRTA